MANEPETLISLLDGWFGGAATTLIGAVMGRAMWHASEARKGNRRFFGKEVLWELPIAVGMALIGESLSEYLGLSHFVGVGLVAALAYFGPRGTEALFLRWFAKKVED